MFDYVLAAAFIGFIGGYLVRDGLDVPDERDPVEQFLDERRSDLQEQYADDRLTHAAFVNRIAIIEDPGTRRIINDAVSVNGVGVETGLEIARTFNADYDAYRSAGRTELERVNGIGENRAEALINR